MLSAQGRILQMLLHLISPKKSGFVITDLTAGKKVRLATVRRHTTKGRRNRYTFKLARPIMHSEFLMIADHLRKVEAEQ
jgi:nucleoside-triphosphatase THEP1